MTAKPLKSLHIDLSKFPHDKIQLMKPTHFPQREQSRSGILFLLTTYATFIYIHQKVYFTIFWKHFIDKYLLNNPCTWYIVCLCPKCSYFPTHTSYSCPSQAQLYIVARTLNVILPIIYLSSIIILCMDIVKQRNEMK